jgi:hypothetical protein
MEELEKRLVVWGNANLYENENAEWVVRAILDAIQETHHVVPKDPKQWVVDRTDGLPICPVCWQGTLA